MYRLVRSLNAVRAAASFAVRRVRLRFAIWRWSALSVSLFLILPGVHPPGFTGNGTNIHMQGGTRFRAHYVYGGWLDVCNQYIRDRFGHVKGVYIDDSININWPSAAQTINCIQQDVAAGWKLIVAAAPQSSPYWNFSQYGATYTALEWYPYCGSSNFLGPAPKRVAYIAQWNFIFDLPTLGLGSGNCPNTPYGSVRSNLNQLGRQRPKMLLYY
jgi:hypothetical protein